MIRPAHRDDVPAIHQLVRELAEYEKEPESAVATQRDFAEALFGPYPAAYAHIAEHTPEDGGQDAEPVTAGFALWFLNFSTWTGRHGIYLEDLYVRPELRGRGYGRALLAELARICNERGYTRLEWWVLDWNTPSIDFYKSLGAVPMDEWTVFRLDGQALTDLGHSRQA
ncbi:L-amino acid N-acyltransferase YncA [Haloactinospora alba]|uniref:L-amino acid N-acyltransferase YncA n=1 Tax=Haloactinospora alba TaxID=405555 RepID=A0A543NFJ4_9ACTN|nr:GNAT family N-acetyltransferase [Haloactinospora alba]TQN30530.1 L-amino acid N-acyltransferase YncA [Haloactinospora alba]